MKKLIYTIALGLTLSIQAAAQTTIYSASSAYDMTTGKTDGVSAEIEIGKELITFDQGGSRLTMAIVGSQYIAKEKLSIYKTELHVNDMTIRGEVRVSESDQPVIVALTLAKWKLAFFIDETSVVGQK